MKARGAKRAKGKREYIVEWRGFAKRWTRSTDAPRLYTKERAARIAEKWDNLEGLRYRIRLLTAKERGGHAK